MELESKKENLNKGQIKTEKQEDKQVYEVKEEIIIKENISVNTPVEKTLWFRIILWCIILFIAGYFLKKISTTILVFLMAFLVAYLINPAIDWLEKKKIPRAGGIGIVYSVFLLFFVLAILFIIPSLINQLLGIYDSISHMTIEDITRYGKHLQEQYQGQYQRFGISVELQKRIESFLLDQLKTVGSVSTAVLKKIITGIANLFSFLFLFITSLIVAIYIVSKARELRDGFFSYLPERYRDDAKDLAESVNKIFGSYLRAQILLCFAVGVLAIIVLYALNFKYALLVGLMMGFGYAIPYFGVPLVTITGGILAFFQQPLLALWVILALFLINQLFDSFITPKFMGENIGISPLLIIFAVFAGGEFLGFWGLLLAIPAAASIKVLFDYIYKKFLAAN